MHSGITREAAIRLLKEYNQEQFHISHALTVEAVMRWFAERLEYHQDIEFWGLVGLLHDVDYEHFPNQHCVKAIELLKQINVSQEFIHAVCCHGYKICTDIEPEHQMEKVLYATDELTGLIGAAAKMRPSKSCKDMEIRSLKKKFKDKAFAAGCSREVIQRGAQMLGWDLEYLLELTLEAMQSCEDNIGIELSTLSNKQGN